MDWDYRIVMEDLKQKAIRGGLARVCAQAATFLVRVGSLMILARLLTPKDFGLLGMVTAFTGVLNLFRDFGLSSAAIQRKIVTHTQVSTLFWINIFIGAVLALLTFACAPAIAAFYHEPRLLGMTSVLAGGFLFNAAGIQHSVLLQRQMRFTALAIISTVSLTAGAAIAIGGAEAGYGYWSLVAMTVTIPLANTIGFWVTSRWIPGMPHWGAGIRSMMRFGGTLTLNGLVAYVAYNLEKVLLGRFWGADAIGLYGRAYQLINIPTDNLNSAIGEVAFSALSRVQDDRNRLRSYFLKGYSLVLSFTVPITIVCAFFADDVVSIILGPQWKEATVIFQLLSPTILIFAVINPLGWLMFSLGLVQRSLKVAFVFTPLIIVGYSVGLPYGPKGVAFAYSAVMLLWVLPHIAWCVNDTVVSFWDVVLAAGRPLAIGFTAGVIAFAIRFSYGHRMLPLPRLILESTVVVVIFFGILVFATEQKSLYLDLLRGLKRGPSLEKETLVSV